MYREYPITMISRLLHRSSPKYGVLYEPKLLFKFKRDEWKFEDFSVYCYRQPNDNISIGLLRSLKIWEK